MMDALQLEGVRPFFSDKFDITKHPATGANLPVPTSH